MAATSPAAGEPPPRPPSFATAMERYQPLARVPGALEPLGAPPPADARFEAAVALAEELESYALLVWADGALVLERYFDPHTGDVRPGTASMHKSVLGLAVAAAIADGAIAGPDEPIGTYIAAWREDRRGAITVREVLTMSTGLAPLPAAGGAQSPAVRYMFDGANARGATLGLALAHEPGTVFHYQNAVSQLLVLVLEAATGRSYQDYVSERLWGPLGADDAYVWLNEEDGFPRGYMAFLARPRDWLRVGLLVKDRGSFMGDRLIPEALMDEASAPSAANPHYGWQIWRGAEHQPARFYNEAETGPSVAASAPFAVDDMLFFDGWGGQRVYISRSADVVIVRVGEARLDWDDAALPNLVLGALSEGG
ncbi:MAG: beta-lactamase family protein [Caulobacterales bacterium]|nr:beta-lactamase family protein [Caulobacterales bacterium]